MDKIVALQNLVTLTNQNVGFAPASLAEFTRISDLIEQKTGTSIGVTTVKRVWGYVKYDGFPARATLSNLARFNGYLDWDTFLRECDTMIENEESKFMNQSFVSADTLSVGDRVHITWYKDKEVDLEYLGTHQFRVTSAVNIKLCEGDALTVHSLSVGLPFYGSDIHRGSDLIPGYLGAQKTGIISIELYPRKV